MRLRAEGDKPVCHVLALPHAVIGPQLLHPVLQKDFNVIVRHHRALHAAGAVEFVIAQRVQRFEAGEVGPHKLRRRPVGGQVPEFRLV